MDWTQIITIILTVISSMVVVWYAFYHIIKEDIKRHMQTYPKHASYGLPLLEKMYNVKLKMYKIEQQIDIKLDQFKKSTK